MISSLFFGVNGMKEEKIEVKEFKGKPTVFVASRENVVEVTTSGHLRMRDKPLKQILQEICEEAKVYAKQIFPRFSYPDGEWYPCGSADVVLRWNDHREIIQLFKKEGVRDGDFWNGWFGKLFKTSSLGWWWFPKLDQGSQSLRYEEEVCRFIRDKLAFANIRVDVRTYID